MTIRYSRTIDMLIIKILQNLDIVEYIDCGTVIDSIYNTQRRGIANAQELLKFKNLRNFFAREYAMEKIALSFVKVLEFTPLLKTVIERLNEYCSKYIKVNK